MARCIFCDCEFSPPEPRPPRLPVEFCENCYWQGRHHEAAHVAAIDAINKFPEVQSASIDHTGGGFFNLTIRLKDGRYLCATEEDGPGVPDAGQPWGYVTHWRDEKTFSEGDSSGFLGSVEGAFTDDQLPAEVQKLIHAA